MYTKGSLEAYEDARRMKDNADCVRDNYYHRLAECDKPMWTNYTQQVSRLETYVQMNGIPPKIEQ